MKTMHAWYSAKQAERMGTAFYLMDESTEVEVTHVRKIADGEPIEPFCKYDDMQYIGVVTRFIRKGIMRSNGFIEIH